jgi:hypothetical protein
LRRAEVQVHALGLVDEGGSDLDITALPVLRERTSPVGDGGAPEGCRVRLHVADDARENRRRTVVVALYDEAGQGGAWSQSLEQDCTVFVLERAHHAASAERTHDVAGLPFVAGPFHDLENDGQLAAPAE